MSTADEIRNNDDPRSLRYPLFKLIKQLIKELLKTFSLNFFQLQWSFINCF